MNRIAWCRDDVRGGETVNGVLRRQAATSEDRDERVAGESVGDGIQGTHGASQIERIDADARGARAHRTDIQGDLKHGWQKDTLTTRDVPSPGTVNPKGPEW